MSEDINSLDSIEDQAGDTDNPVPSGLTDIQKKLDSWNYDYLNESQKDVVEHRTGPCIVLASAGSGKTTALINRTLKLLKDGISPGAIFLTTFTKQAAEELKKRMANYLPEKMFKPIKIGTMHSLSYRFLMRYRGNQYKKVLMGADQHQAVRTAARGIGVYQKIDTKIILDQISFCKNNLFFRDEWKKVWVEQKFDPTHYNIALAYEEEKRKKKLIDFDDMLFEFYELLDGDSKVRKELQEELKYIMVDESQDNTTCQLAIAERLAAPENNIMLVGDDHQAIYSWRGARPDVFIDWSKGQGIRKIIFGKNYRSAACIIKAANSLIKYNINQSEKEMDESSTLEGRITYRQYETRSEESKAVSSEIGALHSAYNTPYKEIAIIYRTNAQSQAFEDALSHDNIPYQVVGGTSFFERPEIVDVLSYLKLTYDPHDNFAFERIINRPFRNLGEGFISELEKNSQGSLYSGLTIFSYTAHANQSRHIKETIDHLGAFSQNYAVEDTIKEILKIHSPWSGGQSLQQYWESDRNKDKNFAIKEGSTRLENVLTLAEMARDFKDCSTFVKYIHVLVQQFTQNQSKADKVSLMTAHKAKGKEYEAVFVAGLNENLMPHFRAISGEAITIPVMRSSWETSVATSSHNIGGVSDMVGLEEERRVCYVAITRAKNWLNLSSYRLMLSGSGIKEVSPSRFLEEMGQGSLF